MSREWGRLITRPRCKDGALQEGLRILLEDAAGSGHNARQAGSAATGRGLSGCCAPGSLGLGCCGLLVQDLGSFRGKALRMLRLTEFGTPGAEEGKRSGFSDTEVSWIFDTEGTESPRMRAFRVPEAGGFGLLWALYLGVPKVRGASCSGELVSSRLMGFDLCQREGLWGLLGWDLKVSG